MRLLIVEDEEDLLEALCYGLRKRGYAVDSTGHGAEAVELCEINNYDPVRASLIRTSEPFKIKDSGVFAWCLWVLALVCVRF